MYIRKTRAEDAAQIAKVQVDSWKTTYKGIVPDDFLNKMNYDFYTDRFQTYFIENSPISYVAIDDSNQIAGYITGGQNRLIDTYRDYDCEIHAIYILEGYQGNQLGKKLVSHLMDDLLRLNHKKMLVQVLAANKAVKFYEKLGGKYLDSKQLSISGKNLEESILGWDDISQAWVD
ncbi:GNAT family N-acetyltransferase [Marinilactibacillus sp. Marseille-P9653]|uniref:GNAT family N-acetyltransferase n=1 Tax=Marinilactibacillus sp. Marseille-P9653 TaxID=2866583 RepID=UPI001CE49D9D|nr:GNAT family N-acetyltransferase [Marinilactibacillus sp. Marseille-P9653]